jgi:16S rRNA (adenine1518-N6/adenine1519-N6)-dimethyltransferase
LVFVAKVIAVEKDQQLFKELTEAFPDAIRTKKLDLLQGDILEFDPEILRFYKEFDYKVVANIPYNLTGQIFRKFLSASYQPERMVILIQKEVADRILARNGKESLLSLSVKAYGTPKLITNVARGNFNPAPRVDSAVISITDISRKKFKNAGFEELFFKIIHAGFAHKRKVLLKNLIDAEIGTRSVLEQGILDLKKPVTVRAEDLSVDNWISLTDLLYTNE